ncbi:MAG TPA: type III-B CRISPR module RAMP protein Cmr6 [Draconibacterium sp.]|nr:type III-B CRISPR module RAMP protein Cmr6 [Draconibacterium sp.]
MNTPNIGWQYYKDYHQIDGDQISLFRNAPNLKGDRRDEYFKRHYEEKNAAILGTLFDSNTSTCLQIVSPDDKLRFKTTYPGLTLGTGYTHETGELGEFKLGFFFDHTTGYPCIPGSTVKGCLRSMFPQKEHEEVANKDGKYNYLASVIRELSSLKEGFIAENELGKEYDEKEHQKRESFIDHLELEIFEGKIPVKKEDGTIENQPICIYNRDIFFDAYLVSTDHPAINRSSYQNRKPFIGDDYITPHINRKKPEMSPFTNPIPLMFLKILPEVTIQFQFDLKAGLLTKEQKQELFNRLLLDFGIGAKTNVGYGQFEEVAVLPSTGKKPLPPLNLPDDQIPDKSIPSLKKKASFPGEMIAQTGDYNRYQFKAGNEVCIVRKRTDKNPALNVGDKVTIHVKLDYKRGAPLVFQVE